MSRAFLDTIAAEIIEAGNFLNQHGWAPATSGNYSMRLDDKRVAITVSGKHKGYLKPEDIMLVDYEGLSLDEKKSSAETLLHTIMYKIDPSIGAVLHTHSVNSTVLTRLLKNESHLRLEGYEMLKVLPGITTHDTYADIPIFENTQDMVLLSEQVASFLKDKPQTAAYLIRGHGLYTWGKNMAEAKQFIEGVEFLIACELKFKSF